MILCDRTVRLDCACNQPLRLSEGAAQTAENCILTEGGLKPLKGTAAVAGVTLGRAVDGTIKTIYRYGQELDSETQSWLQSTRT